MSLLDSISALRADLERAADAEEESELCRQIGVKLAEAGVESIRRSTDFDMADECFEQSAVYYHRSAKTLRFSGFESVDNSQYKTLPAAVQDAIVMSLHSRDESTQEQAATEAIEMPIEYVKEFPSKEAHFYYTRALGGAIIDHPATEAYFEQVDPESMANDEASSPYQSGLWTSLDGVLSNNRDTIEDGIEALLKTHTDSNSDSEVFFEGVAMTNLARKHGHDITPESPAIPDELLTPAGQS